MNSKKGVSSVIATVLIILITVAAVAVLWRFVIPMIQESTEGSSACVDAVNAVSYVSHNLNETSGSLYVTVMSMDGSEKLVNVTVSCISDSESNSSSGEAPGMGETETYKIENCSGAHTIRIAPIVSLSSGSYKVCDYVEVKI